jgi:protein-S-isoprenylcysteine O-methyltransferase Ste14
MLLELIGASLAVSALALLYARREYRRRGRLSWKGLSLLCAMLLLPNLVIDLATRFRWPSEPLAWIGVAIAAAGIALCLAGMLRFRSLSQVLCLDPGALADAGPYRFSRNPQYLGWLLFLLGFSLTDWSRWCLAAIGVVAVSLHLLVLIEEEHLERTFGEPYRAFHRQTPRYLGWQVPRRETV